MNSGTDLGSNNQHTNGYSSRKILFLLLVCCAGLAFLVWVRCGGAGIPCVFHEVTGLKCPGCGITRMIAALSAGDLGAAWRANPFLLATLPYLIFLLAYNAFRWVRNERTGPKFEAAAVVYCAGLVIFGVLRNLV